MRLLAQISLTALLVVLFAQGAQAQAWERNSRIIFIGVGGAQFHHYDPHFGTLPGSRTVWHSEPSAQFMVQGEFGVHDYVGLGFVFGVGGRPGYGNAYRSEVNMPVGMIANFHFYQLIDDKNGKNLHADKLDIYAGMSLGSGIGMMFYADEPRLVPVFFGGPHVGLRWYPKSRVGLNVELGYGKSIACIGVVVRL